MTDEKYQGWANRETWAFNLHWSNDQGLYNMLLEDAREFVAGEDRSGYEGNAFARRVGEHVIEWLEEQLDSGVFGDDTERMLRKEIGSFWRVDEVEVGDSVLESLTNEGMVDEVEVG